MRQLFFLTAVFLFTASFDSFSQTPVYYQYDAVGNSTGRSIYVGGGGSKGSEILSNDKKLTEEVLEDDTFGPETLKIYPNPTKGLLEVEAPSDSENIGTFRILVTDVNGKIIIDRKMEPGRTILDLNDQPEGLYILNLIRGQQKSVWKIIRN